MRRVLCMRTHTVCTRLLVSILFSQLVELGMSLYALTLLHACMHAHTHIHIYSQLIELDMSLYALTLLLELLSLLRLRWVEPHLHRPYRIPLGRVPLALALAPLMGINVCVLAYSLRSARKVAIWVAILASGVLLRKLGPKYFAPPRSTALARAGHGVGPLPATP